VIRRTAVKQVSEAFSGEVAMAVISSDNDPDLIWDAMPFTLKRILISDFAISIYSSMIYYFLKSKT